MAGCRRYLFDNWEEDAMRILLRLGLSIIAIFLLMACTHTGQFSKPFPYDPERAAIDARKKADVEAWEAHRERKIVRGLGGVIYNYQ